MSFGVVVHSALSADAAVIALVGTEPVRVYPGKLPQTDAVPAVVYQVIVDLPLNSLQGFTSGTRNARLQLDAYARTYLEAQTLADAIEAVLGSIVSPSLSSLQVSRRDLYEDAVELHRVTLDFSLWSTT